MNYCPGCQVTSLTSRCWVCRKRYTETRNFLPRVAGPNFAEDPVHKSWPISKQFKLWPHPLVETDLAAFQRAEAGV